MPITIKQCNETMPEISAQYRLRDDMNEDDDVSIEDNIKASYRQTIDVPESITEYLIKFWRSGDVSLELCVRDKEEPLCDQTASFSFNEWQWKSFQEIVKNANG